MSAAPEGPRADGATARTAVYGVVFNLLSYLLTRGLNLLITIMLARVLMPEGMGLIAAALLAIELIDIVYGFGLREMLIYDRNSEKRRQSTAFFVICIVAVLQMLAMLAAAPLSASLVDDPLIVPIMMWLALLFPIASAGAVHEAILLKTLEFKKVAGAEMLSVIAKAAVALSMLWLGFGVWSFVASMFAAHIVRTAAFWVLCDWRPRRPDLRWSTILRQLRYGQHIVFTSSIGKIQQRSDQLSIVASMGDASLGVYFIASRIPDIVLLGVSITLSKVVFPTLASAAGNRERLISMYFNTMYGCAFLMAPISVGVACIAPAIVYLLFGEEWSAAIPVLVILALTGIPKVVGWSAGDVFKATGRPELLTYVNIVQTTIVTPFVFAVAWITRDLVAIALAMLVGQVVFTLLSLGAMKRYEGVGILPSFGAALKPIIASFIMGAVVLAAQSAFASLGLGVNLLLSIFVGSVTYTAAMLVIDGKNCIKWLKVMAPDRFQPT
ncbi:MAG: lipopolysaccharide biosynthesis protein [Paracoccaceae bacterium]|nr:lipopolysaccharide biosynthesis protein [Paracoccaceae bacterium]